MKRIVWEDSDRVVKWVVAQLGEQDIHKGVGIGVEVDGELAGGVIFANHDENSVLMHVASNGTRQWLTPAFLGFIFHYAFLQLKCERITGLVRSANIVAQKFDEHIGFVREGQLRRACADGTDIIVYGMLKEECRFLTGKYHAAYLEYFGIPRSADSSLSESSRQESACYA